MRRFAPPVLGVSAALLLLSLAGFGLGEGGVVGGIFGAAFGAVLHFAGGAAGSGDHAGDGDALAHDGDSGDSGGGDGE